MVEAVTRLPFMKNKNMGTHCTLYRSMMYRDEDISNLAIAKVRFECTVPVSLAAFATRFFILFGSLK